MSRSVDFRNGMEVITSELPSFVHFDFEAMLRKHFGLKGEFYSEGYKQAVAIEDEEERDKAFDALLDKSGPDAYYTEEAWEAWGRALDFIDDLEDAGIIDSNTKGRISTCFCDNA